MDLVGLGMEKHVLPRKPYPTGVSDEEWAFVAPYPTLMPSETRPMPRSTASGWR
jgi:hypothetical protein